MNHTLRKLRVAFVVVAVLVALGAMAGMTSAAPAEKVPLQGMSCSWTSFGQSTRGNFHSASAMTTMSGTMVIYGGVSSQAKSENTVAMIDFTNPGINNATHGSKNFGSALQRYGAAGAFRSNGNQAYFVGGADDSGDADNSLQMWDQNTNTWNSNVSTDGAAQDRVFAAAAYDPDGDRIIVVGGAQHCDAFDFDPSGPPPDTCQAANYGTAVLSFDAQGAHWGTMSGGPRQILGGTMVYDPAGKRMIFFGGTTAFDSNPKSDVSVLDLTNDTWSTLSTSGSVTARAFHSAAFDVANNRMIVYGGVRSNAFLGNEGTVEDTWALDFNMTPPTWSNLGATETSSAVGSVMEYDAVNNLAILHGGRRKGGGNLNVTNKSYYLNCTAGPTVTNTPMPTTPSTPGMTPGTTTTPGTAVPPTAVPTQSGPGAPKQCDFINGRVPQAVINFALTNNAQVGGWGQLCFASRPPSPYNGFREYLTLRNISKPYHPLYNSVVYKCGCP